jgi:tRNA threonylcarbamoyladenosine biosynthesis protein TsaB
MRGLLSFTLMLVLGLDTTTRAGSCALTRDGVLVREQASDAARPQAARLPAELMVLLDREGVSLRDLDVFAVATGPGSFTGMRVGIATMQGLAFAAGRPLVGVSAFDALAARAANGLVATWVDAWRGEVYAALYESGREVEAPTVEPPEVILKRLRAERIDPGPREDRCYIVFIGDGAEAHATTIRTALGDAAAIADPVTPLLAGTIAVLATDAARAGHTPPPHAIRPLYVRRPDPELARDARAGR